MIDNNPPAAVAASYAIDWQTVSLAIGLAARFASAFSLEAVSDNARARLAIVVEEVVANIVEHGQCPAGSEIQLGMALAGDHIELNFEDEGIAFDPVLHDSLARPLPERGGGAGLALVKHMAQAITYERADGRNRLKLLLSCHG